MASESSRASVLWRQLLTEATSAATEQLAAEAAAAAAVLRPADEDPNLAILVKRFPSATHAELAAALDASEGELWNACDSLQAIADARAPRADSATDLRTATFAEVKALMSLGEISAPMSLDTKQRLAQLQRGYPDFGRHIVLGALRIEAGNSGAAGKRLRELAGMLDTLSSADDAAGAGGGACSCM